MYRTVPYDKGSCGLVYFIIKIEKFGTITISKIFTQKEFAEEFYSSANSGKSFESVRILCICLAGLGFNYFY